MLYKAERGIRTPGSVTLNGFQDRRYRPLSHLSIVVLTTCVVLTCAKVRTIFGLCKFFEQEFFKKFSTKITNS